MYVDPHVRKQTPLTYVWFAWIQSGAQALLQFLPTLLLDVCCYSRIQCICPMVRRFPIVCFPFLTKPYTDLSCPNIVLLKQACA